MWNEADRNTLVRYDHLPTFLRAKASYFYSTYHLERRQPGSSRSDHSRHNTGQRPRWSGDRAWGSYSHQRPARERPQRGPMREGAEPERSGRAGYHGGRRGPRRHAKASVGCRRDGRGVLVRQSATHICGEAGRFIIRKAFERRGELPSRDATNIKRHLHLLPR